MGVLGDAGFVILKDHMTTPPLHHIRLENKIILNIIAAQGRSGLLFGAVQM